MLSLGYLWRCFAVLRSTRQRAVFWRIFVAPGRGGVCCNSMAQNECQTDVVSWRLKMTFVFCHSHTKNMEKQYISDHFLRNRGAPRGSMGSGSMGTGRLHALRLYGHREASCASGGSMGSGGSKKGTVDTNRKEDITNTT